jgi:hypothetical protein
MPDGDMPVEGMGQVPAVVLQMPADTLGLVGVPGGHKLLRG